MISKKAYHTIFVATFFALLTCQATATPLNSPAAQKNECAKIDFLPETHISLPVITEENIEDTLKFLSTDKEYEYTSKMCIEIRNISKAGQNVTMRLDNPRIRHVEIFNEKDGGISLLTQSGLDYPLKNWQTLGSEISFSRLIEAGEAQKVYMQVGSISPYNSRMIISGSESYFSSVISQQLSAGILAGFIFALVFYTAAIGVSARDQTYLYLFGSTVSVTLLQLNDIGLLYPLWPDALYWNNISSGVLAVLSTIFGTALARSYLLTKDTMPQADMLLRLFAWYLGLVALPAALLENDKLFLFVFPLPTILFFLPLILTLSIIRIRQNYTPAKIYLVALATPVIAGLCIFLMYVGIIPSSPVAKIFPLTGTAIQLIFFAVALGERINWLKDQRNISLQNELAIKTEAAAKKTFLAHISHELRTPLAGIIGLADLAKKNPLYATNKPLIDGINESAAHLLSTTNTLLDHARIDAEKFLSTSKTFDPELLVRELIEKNTAAARRKNITISLNTNTASNKLIVADSDIIGRIIDILIENIINLSSDANILINCEIFKKNDNIFLRFDIISSSEKFYEKLYSKTFDTFEFHDPSTTREQHGLGLGLSLAKKLCNLLDGEISYNINPEHGPAFWCVIPCSAPPEISPVDTPSNTGKRVLSNSGAPLSKRVLVAEDDETLQLIISHQLDVLQLSHTVFPNGKPLIEEYKRNYQDVGMVLLDWNMPICNARDAIAAIREYEANNDLLPVTIAVLSAYDKHNATEMNLSSEIKLLQKPVTTDDLSRLIFAKHST